MSAMRRRLDQLQVVSPCREGWDKMTGDEKKRFCAQCNKFVYDFSQMTRRQIEAVVSIHQGQLCAMITRRPDGSILMLETPPLLPESTMLTTRRTSPIVNATIAAILGISVPATAQSTIISNMRFVAESKTDRGGEKTQVGDAVAPVSGIVLDPKGEAIRGAMVKLISSEGEERKMKTSANGEFSFPQVPYGSYLLMTEAPGFYTNVNSGVVVDTPHELRFELTLSAKQELRTVGGAIAGPPPSLFDLYRNSDLVAIAEVGPSLIAGSEGEVKIRRTSLKISSLLKGDTKEQAIPFYHWAADHFPAPFRQGDRLLVFLQSRESEDGITLPGYEPSNWGDAIKKLDDAQLSVYRLRIEELAQLLQRSDPDPVEITEWLVRLVEDPVTRMEGARKLSRVLFDLPEKEDAVEEAEQLETDEEDSDEKSAREEMEKERRANALIAAALNQDQKNRLAAALYGIAELDESDLDLVWLIQQLDDQRLTTYLVSQLQRISSDAPRLAEPLTQIIASAVKDEDLHRLAKDYSDAVRYEVLKSFNRHLDTGSESEPRPIEEKIAGLKLSPRLKDFLRLVEFKTKR